MYRSLLTILVIATFALPACEKAPEQKAPQAAAQDKTEQPTAASQKGVQDCIGEVATSQIEEKKIAGKKWQQNGSTLTEMAKDKDNKMVIGALTDIKEPSPENIANIKKFLQWFKKKKVDLVIVDGDIGSDQNQIEKSLLAVSGIAAPVGVIIGNHESSKDFRNAFQAVSAKKKNLVNLNEIRRINGDDADIITMPGYYDRAYLHSEEGCYYTPEDTKKLLLLAKFCDSPVVLVSHGPPRQSGKNGIDVVPEGDNRGDPALAKIIEEGNIPFGIFGNIHEAGGKATNLMGTEVIKPGEKVSNLYINPGPTDAVQWRMNDGTESKGMAAIITIEGDKAAYEIFRIPSK